MALNYALLSPCSSNGSGNCRNKSGGGGASSSCTIPAGFDPKIFFPLINESQFPSLSVFRNYEYLFHVFEPKYSNYVLYVPKPNVLQEARDILYEEEGIVIPDGMVYEDPSQTNGEPDRYCYAYIVEDKRTRKNFPACDILGNQIDNGFDMVLACLNVMINGASSDQRCVPTLIRQFGDFAVTGSSSGDIGGVSGGSGRPRMEIENPSSSSSSAVARIMGNLFKKPRLINNYAATTAVVGTPTDTTTATTGASYIAKTEEEGGGSEKQGFFCAKDTACNSTTTAATTTAYARQTDEYDDDDDLLGDCQKDWSIIEFMGEIILSPSPSDLPRQTGRKGESKTSHSSKGKKKQQQQQTFRAGGGEMDSAGGEEAMLNQRILRMGGGGASYSEKIASRGFCGTIACFIKIRNFNHRYCANSSSKSNSSRSSGDDVSDISMMMIE